MLGKRTSVEGSLGERIHTADSGFLVLLEIIVHEAEYEGGLEVFVKQC